MHTFAKTITGLRMSNKKLRIQLIHFTSFSYKKNKISKKIKKQNQIVA